ncbi:hypothetical protein Enr10x_19440 [Gimesia panareensis]|uniref:Preprotein translocase subunit SecD n=1 Tax=Gimesia panareensis TaxID=2527978 RepID=A0A517Q4U6_9PLAN|nr:DUF6263 family protein [Gimesia panareensis]QDT26639.1 hypothetical protein Enr10x_19440 [Gimesia panareensis]
MRSIVFCLLTLMLSQFSAPLSVTSAAEEEAKSYSLRYKFTPNEFVHYSVESTNQITVQLNQNKQTSANASNTLKHYRVISVNEEGNGTLETRIDRVKMSVQFDNATPATFDSEQPPEKDLEQFKPIRANISKPTRVVYSPVGKVIKILELNIGQDGAKFEEAKAPGKIDQEQKRRLGFLIPLPEEDVKIGDSWNDDLDVEVALSKTLRKKVPVRRTFTLDAVEDGTAVITFKTKIMTRLNDPKLSMQLIQKTPSGTIKLDLERGILISQDVSLDKAQVGVFDGKGAMRAVTTRVETLVDPTEVAQKEQATDSQ